MFIKVLQNTLVVLCAVGTVVAALEIFGRVIPVDSLPASLPVIVQTMRLHADSLFRSDPYFHYITNPGVDFLFQHPEFTYRVNTKLNVGQAGFRGGTLGGPTWGVALGDSFTFGMGVEHESTWVAQLASLKRKEIMNLGVPGWGPQQYTRALERFGPPLRPKVVLYALYRNDLQDVLHFDQWSRDSRPKQAIEAFLRIHSITFNLFRILAVANVNQGKEAILLDNFEFEFNHKKVTQALLDDRDRFAAAWAITKKEIERAIDYSQSMSATFVLIYLPSKDEAYWEFIRQKDVRLKSYDDSADILRSRIPEFCKARRIRCLDLTPAFRLKAAQGRRLYYSHDSHLNKEGNRVAAEEIGGYLLAEDIT